MLSVQGAYSWRYLILGHCKYGNAQIDDGEKVKIELEDDERNLIHFELFVQVGQSGISQDLMQSLSYTCNQKFHISMSYSTMSTDVNNLLYMK